ncbi:MAG: ABC transporter permease [Actinobacteria bacterium]|nr:ABC transporter permease [Actinomycetota bacterium]
MGVTRRLARALITLLVSSFVIFSALYVAPGSPLAFLSRGRTLSPEALAGIAAQYNLDKPFLERYVLWLGDAIHGDFGRSIVSHDNVTTLLAPRIGVTLMLVAMAAVLIICIGVALGVLAGVRGGRTEAGISVLTTIGLATPSFVMATILLNFFALKLGWFPVYGAGEGFTDRLWHLTLPAVALAISGVGYVALISGTAVRSEMDSEHSEASRARGLAERKVVSRHVLRNSMIPITTVCGLAVAALIAGDAVVEKAFEVPGIGALLVDSVSNKDFAVVQAVSLIMVAVFIVVNAIVDLLCLLLDPRLRRS